MIVDLKAKAKANAEEDWIDLVELKQIVGV